MAHENHRASKIVVDYAALHRRAIVLEDLSRVRAKGSKIIPIVYINPAYTGKGLQHAY